MKTKIENQTLNEIKVFLKFIEDTFWSEQLTRTVARKLRGELE